MIAFIIIIIIIITPLPYWHFVMVVIVILLSRKQTKNSLQDYMQRWECLPYPMPPNEKRKTNKECQA